KERGLIDQDANGTYSPHDWNAHQYASDHSTERVKIHRMKRNETVSETVNETFQKRLARATDTDTEAETEKQRESATVEASVNGASHTPSNSDLNAAIQRMYAKHPKRKDRKLAFANIAQAVLIRPLEEIEQCHAAWCQTKEW